MLPICELCSCQGDEGEEMRWGLWCGRSGSCVSAVAPHRLRPHPREGRAVGSAGLALHPGRPQEERGGDHEGPLAEVWQELLHQVGKVLLTPPIP